MTDRMWEGGDFVGLRQLVDGAAMLKGMQLLESGLNECACAPVSSLFLDARSWLTGWSILKGET